MLKSARGLQAIEDVCVRLENALLQKNEAGTKDAFSSLVESNILLGSIVPQ